MIILRHGRYISGAKIFRAGEILPDTPGVQELVAKGMAEAVADVKIPKCTKKRESESVPKNVESNS